MRYREIKPKMKVWVKAEILEKDNPKKQEHRILVEFPDCPIRCKPSELKKRGKNILYELGE